MICVAALAAGSHSVFAAGTAAKGKEVFDQCSVCHNADSDEKKIGPGLKGLFKKDKLVNGKKPSDATVREKIDDTLDSVEDRLDKRTAEKANQD